MKPHIASIINAFTLMILGLWAYFTSESPSMTALIPVIIGAVLVLLNPGVKKEAKIPAHIAVVLTLVCLIGLYKPLSGAFERGSNIGIARISIMILTTAFALITFIRSFAAVRRQRKLEEQSKQN